jgi:ATP-binding cassette subfamily B protein
VLCQARMSVGVGQRLIRDLREQQFAHSQALALSHHEANTTGNSVQLLEADARCVDQLVFRGVFPLVFSVLTLLVMFGVLLSIDSTLALLSIAIVPPLFFWIRRAQRKVSPAADDARRADSRLSSRIAEVHGALPLIRSHAREGHEQERFSSVATEAARASIRLGRESAAFTIVGGVLTAMGTSAVLLVGGRAVVDGQLSVGTLLLVLACLANMYGPLSASSLTVRTRRCSTASISMSRRARWWRSLARRAPASPRWRACCSDSTIRPTARSGSMAGRSIDISAARCAGRWRSCSRIRC